MAYSLLSGARAELWSGAGLFFPSPTFGSATSGGSAIAYGRDANHDAGTDQGDYYVDPVNGSDAAAGTSWGTAKLTLGAAYTAASAGDTIEIGAGTLPETLTVSKANLTIKSRGTARPNLTGFDTATGWTVVNSGNKTTNDNNLLGSTLADSGTVYKLNIDGADMAVNDGAALNIYENGTFVPLVQNRRFSDSTDGGFFAYDEDYLRADSFTLNGSNQITAIVDANASGNGKDLSVYTSAQATNAIVYLYRNPNGVTKVNVTAFSGTTLTVDGLAVVQGNTSSPAADNLRYNLANILPELSTGQYGYYDVGDGTWDVYLIPTDTANLTSNIQYSARSSVITVSADNLTLEGLDITGTASDSALGGFVVGDSSSSVRAGFTSRHCRYGDILNSSGSGYGALYLKNIDSVLFEYNTIERCYGAYGLFGNGGSLSDLSQDGIYRYNHVKTIGQAGMRFYAQETIQVAYNFFETCGYGGHTNVLNFYEQSNEVLVYGNKCRDALGYLTWQEASNLYIGFNDIPCNPDNLDDRSIQDQANSTPAPVIGSTTYIWNNLATPDPNNLNSSGCYDLGKPDLVAGGDAADARDMLFVMLNNIIHGGGVSEPYAGLGAGEQNWPSNYETRDGNFYTDLAFWQAGAYGWSLAANEAQQVDLSLVYNDAANGDFTLTPSSPLRTHTGVSLTTTIAAASVFFPSFDFTKDMNGDAISTTAPKAGPRADPATWTA